MRTLAFVSLCALALFSLHTNAAAPFSWSSDDYQPTFIDLNADGIDDLFLHSRQDEKPSVFIIASELNGQFHFLDTAASELPSTLDGKAWSASNTKVIFGDFNRNGVNDAILLNLDDSTLRLSLHTAGSQLFTEIFTVSTEGQIWTEEINAASNIIDIHSPNLPGALFVATSENGRWHLIGDEAETSSVTQILSIEEVWTDAKRYEYSLIDVDNDDSNEIFAESKYDANHYLIKVKGAESRSSVAFEPLLIESGSASTDWLNVEAHLTWLDANDDGIKDLVKTTNVSAGFDVDGSPFGIDENNICEHEFYNIVDQSYTSTCVEPLKNPEIQSLTEFNERPAYETADLCVPVKAPEVDSAAGAEQVRFTSNCFEEPPIVAPEVPSDAPSIGGGNYHPVGSNYTVWIGSVENASYYLLQERRGPFSGGQWVSIGGELSEFGSVERKSNNSITIEYRYAACNVNDQCSTYGAVRRMFVYREPWTVPTIKASHSKREIGQNVTLSWNKAQGLVPGYESDVKVTRPDGSEFTNSTKGENLSILGSENGIYKFSVRTCNPGNRCTKYSDPVSVNFVYPKPAEVTVMAPAAVAVGQAFDVVVSPVAHAVKYEIYLNDVFYASSFSDTVTVSAFDKVSRQCFRARGINGNDVPGELGDEDCTNIYNNPPQALNDSGDVVEGGSIDIAVTDNDSDLDGHSINVVSNTKPSKGSANCDSQTCTYTAPSNISSDTSSSFSYTIEDALGGQASATVSVNITNLKPATMTVGADQTVEESSGILGLKAQVVENDTSLTSFTWRQTSGLSVAITDSTKRSASFSIPAVDADTTLAFEAEAKFVNGQVLRESMLVTVLDKEVFEDPTLLVNAEQTVEEASGIVYLTADISANSASLDSVTWSQKQGEILVSLEDINTATAFFDAPEVPKDTVLSFEVTATFAEGITLKDTIDVNILDVTIPEILSLKPNNGSVLSVSQPLIAEATTNLEEEQISAVLYSLNDAEFVTVTETPFSYDFGIQLGGAHTLSAKVQRVDGIESEVFVSEFTYSLTSTTWSEKGGETADSPNVGNVRPTEATVYGAIQGNAGVSGGAASYSVPIQIPPGRNGAQPQISVNYSSRSGNGLLGVGWSVSAGGSITRCAATFAQDGYKSGIKFEASTDKLCYNGQRLMLLSGTYGSVNAEYKTEIDSLSIVRQVGGSIDSQNSAFEVSLPNGHIEKYGTNKTSKLVPVGVTSPLSWHITSATDATGNNVIEYQYLNDQASAELLLTDIFYTGTGSSKGDRKVSFVYENRDYTSSSSVYGGFTSSTKRLKSIDTYYKSSAVKKYEFDYQSGGSNSSRRDLLSSIHECNGALTTCKAVTSVDWHDAQQLYQTELLTTNSGEPLIPVDTYVPDLTRLLPRGDVDGNGSRDWPSYFVNADGDSEGANFTELQNCDNNPITFQPVCHDGDFDLDGLSDSWAVENGFINISLSSLAKRISTSVVIEQYDSIETISDFNGDGWPDIVVHNINCGGGKGGPCSASGDLNLYIHSTNPSNPYSSLPVLLTKIDTRESFNIAGDMDGNGFIDVAISHQLPQMSRPVLKDILLISQAKNGNVLTQRIDASVQSQKLYEFTMLIDINGDGYNDWIGWIEGGSTKLYARINLGDATFSDAFDTGISLQAIASYIPGTDPLEPDYASSPRFIEAFKQMDINGDGRMELILPSYDKKDIVASFCREYKKVNGAGNPVNVKKCGHQLREPDISYVGGFEVENYPETRFDANIYRYQAITFSGDMVNGYSASFISPNETNLIASANNAFVIDGLGKGLSDLVFAFGCPTSGCYLESIKAGAPSVLNGNLDTIMFNRNYGSALNSQPSPDDYMATDIIKSINNGFGLEYEWQLRPLSANPYDDFYSADFSSIVDDAHHLFASSMYVVSEFTASNGIGGKNLTRYRYGNAMFNTQGRGFRGFETITSENVTRGTQTQTLFKQKFPFSSLIAEQTVSQVGTYKGRLSRTVNDWRLNTLGIDSQIAYQIFNAESKQTTYKVNDGDARVKEVTVSINPSDGIDAYGNVVRKVTTTEILDDTSEAIDYTITEALTFLPSHTFDNNWPNKLSESTVTKKASLGSAVPRPLSSDSSALLQNITTKLTWDSEVRKPSLTIVAPGKSSKTTSQCASSSQACSVTSVKYNSYGLPTLQSEEGDIVNGKQEQRSVAISYSKNGSIAAADGYFAFEMTADPNGKRHVTTTTTLPHFGTPLSQTDPFGITVENTYDDFGRPISMSTPGSKTVFIDYTKPESQPPSSHVRMVVTNTQAGAPSSKEYIDALGRTIASASQNFEGDWVYTKTVFDALGRAIKQSAPYTGSPIYTTYSYDVLDRALTKETPATDSASENLFTSYAHDGLTTSITVNAPDASSGAGNLFMERRYGFNEQLLFTKDAEGYYTRYSYGAGGAPTVVQDAQGHNIYAIYDELGRKLRVEDPNQGVTHYQYNDFGDVIEERDANDDLILYSYDALGRVYKRESDAQTAIFNFDGCGKGLLCSETLGGEFSKHYDYDHLARLTDTTTRINGNDYRTEMAYDAGFGRVKSLTYPNGLTLAYQYNRYGYLTHEMNAASGYVYREITDQDKWGNISGARISNQQLRGEYRYSSRTGQMLWSKVSATVGDDLHELQYTDYDSYGNLRQQENRAFGPASKDNFTYDALQRLTRSSTTAAGTSLAINYRYDEVGNLLAKSDYSVDSDNAYRYFANNNRLKQVSLKNGGTVSFDYDNKGNQTKRNNIQEVWFNSFNKPTRIERLGSRVDVYYGADAMRYKQVRVVEGKSVTTHYIDKLYEVEISEGLSTQISYISDVAILRESSAKRSIRFTHKDRLGSAATFTDHNGQVTARRHFDPFGKPKGGDWSSLDGLGARLASTDDDMATRRGFTDHEHLDEVELIHMNGRIYDYNIGRFLSVDPFIQGTGSQGINPYSYVLNNPLSFTDPTGYTVEAEVDEVKTKKV
ncbi:RHS repeat-associated core domain-containing protein, partial [Glaciecola siphonariae]